MRSGPIAALLLAVAIAPLGAQDPLERILQANRGALDRVPIGNSNAANVVIAIQDLQDVVYFGLAADGDWCVPRKLSSLKVKGSDRRSETVWRPEPVEKWATSREEPCIFADYGVAFGPTGIEAESIERRAFGGLACFADARLKQLIRRYGVLVVEFELECDGGDQYPISWPLHRTSVRSLRGLSFDLPPGYSDPVLERRFDAEPSNSATRSGSVSAERTAPEGDIGERTAPSSVSSGSQIKAWIRGLNEVDELLRLGESTQALGKLNPLIQDLIAQHPEGPVADLLAAATFTKALALASNGERRDAFWYWNLAQSLEPMTHGQDFEARLEQYGTAGAMLAAESQKLLDADLPAVYPQRSVTPPEAVRMTAPAYPPILEEKDARTTVDVQYVVGADGRTQSPAIVEGDDLIMALVCLEAVKTWQYRPASLEGEPVPVFSTLTCRLE